MLQQLPLFSMPTSQESRWESSPELATLDTDTEDFVDEIRDLFQHDGSEAELVELIQKATLVLHELCDRAEPSHHPL